MNKYGTFGSQEGVEAEITRLKSRHQLDLHKAEMNLARHRQNGWPTKKADRPERITRRYEERLAGLTDLLDAEPTPQSDLEEAVEPAVVIGMPTETTLETAVAGEISAAETAIAPLIREATSMYHAYQAELEVQTRIVARNRRNGRPIDKLKTPEKITEEYESRVAELERSIAQRLSPEGNLGETAVSVESPLLPTGEVTYSSSLSLRTLMRQQRRTFDEESVRYKSLKERHLRREAMYSQYVALMAVSDDTLKIRAADERLPVDYRQELEAMYSRFTVPIAGSDDQLRIQAANERLSADDRRMLEETPGGLARTTTEEQYLAFLPPEN